jgi:hypothetical protein
MNVEHPALTNFRKITRRFVGEENVKCSAAAWLSMFPRDREHTGTEKRDLVSSEIMIGPLQYKRKREKKKKEIMHVALSCVSDYQRFSEASGNRRRFFGATCLTGFFDNSG